MPAPHTACSPMERSKKLCTQTHIRSATAPGSVSQPVQLLRALNTLPTRGRTMPTGIVLFPNPKAIDVVDDVVAQARRAYSVGVRQVWLGQQFDHDAIALAALVGAAVPGLGVGTAVVPINPRHPLIVASLAQTAQAASHGNFSLGLGLGAHEPERQAFGRSWPNTIGRLREHLQVLRSIFDTGTVDFTGEEITAQPGWPVQVAGGRPIPIYVAARGPK